MADGASELSSKILRLQVRYDGMSDARVAEKKALEDEIRGLQDQLDELQPPNRVAPESPADTPMQREAKQDIDAVKDIFGAEDELTRLQRALARERSYQEDLRKQPYNVDTPDNMRDSDEKIRTIEHRINALDPTTEDIDLLADSGAAIAGREAADKYRRDQDAAKKAAENAAKAKRDAYEALGPAERAVIDEQKTLEGFDNPHLEEQLDAAHKKDDVLRRSIDESQKKGCITPPKVLAGVGIGAAVVIAVILVILNGGTDDNTKTSAGAPNSAAADEADSSATNPLDGHWVLASGLQNINGKDTGRQGFGTGPEGTKGITLDTSSATIDISGTQITGGTYKTGITQTYTNEFGCYLLGSKVDLKPSGSVDQTAGYGTLVLDGPNTVTSDCESSATHRVETETFHIAHYIYVKGDSLFLCYALDVTTFDSCTDPAGGSAAIFQRG